MKKRFLAWLGVLVMVFWGVSQNIIACDECITEIKLKETSFTPSHVLPLMEVQAVMNADIGGSYSPAYLITSKPPVGLVQTDGAVSILNAKWIFEVGTVLSFSYVRNENGGFVPTHPLNFGGSYWADLLENEIVLILDDSKMSSSVSATRIKYAHEVTLTKDMIGRRLGIGFYGEMFGYGGGASESMFELEVVPEGTLVTFPEDRVKLAGVSGLLELNNPILDKYDANFFPFEDVVCGLGGSVHWNGEYQILTGNLNGHELRISTKNLWYALDDNGLDHTYFPEYLPFIYNDITYIRDYVFFEFFDYDVSWDKETGILTLLALENIKVMLNDTMIQFDQPPIMQEGRTLVPLRAIFEALGASVDWNGDTQTVTAVKDDIIISLQIGSNVLNKNGKNITLNVPAQLVNGRTLVPARAVAESFGASVDWDNDSQTVLITQ